MTFDFWNDNKKKVKKIFCPVTDFITFEKKKSINLESKFVEKKQNQKTKWMINLGEKIMIYRKRPNRSKKQNCHYHYHHYHDDCFNRSKMELE